MYQSVRSVTFLLSSLKFGGGERVALNLAHVFKARGLQVDFVLMSHEGEFLAEAIQHFNVVNLNCDRTWKLPIKLGAYLGKNRPDALIASFWKLNLCACLARAAHPRVRLLLWEHSSPSKSKNSPKWLYAVTASVAYQFANKVIAVSTGVHHDISHWTVGLRRKLIVIFNPIPPPHPRVFSQPRPPQTKQVVWVGRLDDPKNPGLALEAFALVPNACNASLVFVGDGSQRAALEQRCIDLGLEGRVKFLGFQPNPYEVMVVSDLLVLSSDQEGLGNVIIEAMYCGLRVVSTDCGEGIHDILLDNRYGTIVPVKDKFALARAIEHELDMPNVMDDQIHGAQRFLPEEIAQQFMSAMQ